MSTELLCPELEVESQDSEEEEEDGLMNLSLRNNEYQNSQMCIVTGPNQDVAIKPIKRMKGLFEHKLAITFANKETVLFYSILISSCLSFCVKYFSYSILICFPSGFIFCFLLKVISSIPFL